jgi:hypothetical protein
MKTNNVKNIIGIIVSNTFIALSFYVAGWKVFIGILLFRLGEVSCNIICGKEESSKKVKERKTL